MNIINITQPPNLLDKTSQGVNKMLTMSSRLKAITGLLLTGLTGFASATDVTLKWDAVEHATHYQLEEEVNGVWVEADLNQPQVAQTFLVDSSKADGTYNYRVSGCVEETGVTIHCGDNVAEYSEVFPLILPPAGANNQRRVIFIHTDLLGSPAAETNEQGVSQ